MNTQASTNDLANSAKSEQPNAPVYNLPTAERVSLAHLNDGQQSQMDNMVPQQEHTIPLEDGMETVWRN